MQPPLGVSPGTHLLGGSLARAPAQLVLRQAPIQVLAGVAAAVAAVGVVAGVSNNRHCPRMLLLLLPLLLALPRLGPSH